MKLFIVAFLVNTVFSGLDIFKCDFEIVNELFTCVIRNKELSDDFQGFFAEYQQEPSEIENFCSSEECDIISTTSKDETLSEFYSEVKQLQFINKKMSHIPDKIFEAFPNIEKLFINVNLLNWHKKYLKGAKRLKTLYIYENSIRRFDSNAFEEVPQLEFLWIEKTQLERINKDIFKPLKSLISLTIRNHDLSSGLEIGTFDALKNTLYHLDISLNRIEKIPKGFFKKFRVLETLNIDGNQLSVEIDANKTLPKSLEKIFVCKKSRAYTKNDKIKYFFISGKSDLILNPPDSLEIFA